MPVKRQRKPPPLVGIRRGVYLTDGVRLYRVLEVLEQNVELENCGHPNDCAQWMGLGEVLKTLTLVRPLP